jgi:hypothetical protein
MDFAGASSLCHNPHPKGLIQVERSE